MNLQEAIDSIWECKQQGIYHPPEWRGKLGIDEGYRVQLGILAKQIKGNERHVGWKVGLTAKAIQDQLDYHERVFGYLLESGMLASGAVVDYDDLVAPSFESELCVTLGRTLHGPKVTPEQARAAIIAVAPSVELVERRGDFTGDLPLALADNAQQRYFVIGPVTEPLPPQVDLAGSRVEIFINGESVDRAAGSEVMGGPAGSIAWLANRLADFGQRLEAGMRIMTGSFTRQHPIAKGDLIEARFEPYGAVVVEFK